MASRRGHGEGTIKHRRDGRWEAMFTLPNGTRRSVYGTTRKGGQDKLRTALRGLAAGLSPRTVHYARGVLRSALGQALKWGIVSRNVATLVDPPHMDKKRVTAL